MENKISAIVVIDGKEYKMHMFDDTTKNPLARRNAIHAFFLSFERNAYSQLGIPEPSNKVFNEIMKESSPPL